VTDTTDKETNERTKRRVSSSVRSSVRVLDDTNSTSQPPDVNYALTAGRHHRLQRQARRYRLRSLVSVRLLGTLSDRLRDSELMSRSIGWTRNCETQLDTLSEVEMLHDKYTLTLTTCAVGPYQNIPPNYYDLCWNIFRFCLP